MDVPTVVLDPVQISQKFPFLATEQFEPGPIFEDPKWTQEQKDLFQKLRQHPQFQDLHRVLVDHIWFSSSGSSARVGDSPKLIALSRRALLSSARGVVLHLQSKIAPMGLWACALPVHHVGGFGIFVRAFLSGDSVVWLRSGWDPKFFSKVLEERKVSWTSLVPAQVFDLVHARLSCPPSVRGVLVGGGRLAPELRLKALALGWPILESFGMTEAASQIATERPALVNSRTQSELELHSLGDHKNVQSELVLLPHVQVQVDPKTSRLSLRGESLLSASVQLKADGSLDIRPGPGSLLYKNKMHMTSDTIKEAESLSTPTELEWWQTEDLASFDERTQILRPLGRATQQVKILGELVNLARVEATVGSSLQASDLLPENVEDLIFMVVAAETSDRRSFELILVLETATLSPKLKAQFLSAQFTEKLLSNLNQNLSALERLSKLRLIDHFRRSSLGKLLPPAF